MSLSPTLGPQVTILWGYHGGSCHSLRSGGCHKKAFTLTSLPGSMKHSTLLQHLAVSCVLCGKQTRAGPQPQLSLLLHVAKQLVCNNLAFSLSQDSTGPCRQTPFFRRWKGSLRLVFFLGLCEPMPQAPCTVLQLAATDHFTHQRGI